MNKQTLGVFVITLLCLVTIVAFAHSGRTDSNGGHWDRQNGGYHYHHGNPPHDHYDIDGDGDTDCEIMYEIENKQTSEDEVSSEPSAIWNDTTIWIITAVIMLVLVLFLLRNADSDSAVGCGCFTTYFVMSILVSIFETRALYVLIVVVAIAIVCFVSYGLYKLLKKKN